MVAQLSLELEPVLVPSPVLEEVVPKGGLPVPTPQTVAPNPLDQITDAGNQHVLFAPWKIQKWPILIVECIMILGRFQ